MLKNKWFQWVVIAIPAFMLLASGFAKLSGSEQVVKGFTAGGLGSYIMLIAIVELVCTILYLLPATRNIGFFLLCSYLGGAMIFHLSHGEPVTAPTVVLVLLWVAMFLTKPGLFIPARTL